MQGVVSISSEVMGANDPSITRLIVGGERHIQAIKE